MVFLEDSKFWSHDLKLWHVALHKSTCSCTLEMTLNPKRHSFAEATNISFKNYYLYPSSSRLSLHVVLKEQSTTNRGSNTISIRNL